MEWWQVLGIILGSNVLVVVIKSIAAKKSERRKRNDTLEDRSMAKNDEAKTLEERFDAFCKAQSDENRELRQRMSGIERTLGTLCETTSSGEYIAMRKEALEYIKRGEVEVEDRVLLRERYDRYKLISQKKDLDNIMTEVDKLKTKRKDT